MGANLSLIELAEQSPNITISIRLSDLLAANKVLIQETRLAIEQQIRDEQNEEYMTIEEVADLLKVDKSTLWRWDHSAYLKRIDVGGQKRYLKSDITKILNKKR
jgi:excisionase family DNA binding protein